MSKIQWLLQMEITLLGNVCIVVLIMIQIGLKMRQEWLTMLIILGAKVTPHVCPLCRKLISHSLIGLMEDNLMELPLLQMLISGFGNWNPQLEQDLQDICGAIKIISQDGIGGIFARLLCLLRQTVGFMELDGTVAQTILTLLVLLKPNINFLLESLHFSIWLDWQSEPDNS